MITAEFRPVKVGRFLRVADSVFDSFDAHGFCAAACIVVSSPAIVRRPPARAVDGAPAGRAAAELGRNRAVFSL